MSGPSPTKKNISGPRRRRTRGFYTVEAAVFLPLILLLLFSFGYYTRTEGAWENLIHCAVDESSLSASRGWDGISMLSAEGKLRSRLESEADLPPNWQIRRFRPDYRDALTDHVTSYELTAGIQLKLPAGFSREFLLRCPVKYRNFVGRDMKGNPLGTEGLENDIPENPVIIFPASGERYHRESCRHVTAAIHPATLSSALRRSKPSCEICHSEELPYGSIVFCFDGAATAYHRSTCRTIDRHTAVIDRSEAEEKGYTPCKTCGGTLPQK